jgi:hypothetical protein
METGGRVRCGVCSEGSKELELQPFEVREN